MLENENVINLTALCKIFSSKNRVGLFLKLLDKKTPINIANDLNLSRAGLQKHLEVLLETGLLVKNGRGRNTTYLPSKIAPLIFQNLQQLGIVLETQREIIRLESTLSTLEDMPANVQDVNKTEFRKSLVDELTVRTKNLENITKDLQSRLKLYKNI